MDFQHSARANALRQQVDDFMDRHVFPVEHLYGEQVQGGDAAARLRTPPVMQQLKALARGQGL
ncbi:MAG: acyl-CoA dehydrogenase, partial [Aquabacterium sp.]